MPEFGLLGVWAVWSVKEREAERNKVLMGTHYTQEGELVHMEHYGVSSIEVL